MLTNNVDWIKRDSYFRTWRRVLIRGGGDFNHQVEIQLTPINNSEADWDTVKNVWITRHDVRYSAFKDTSLWTHNLPEEVYSDMVANLGQPHAAFLFNADIYSLIDWNKFGLNNNGGCSLEDCQKDSTGYFSMVTQEGDTLINSQVDEGTFKKYTGISSTGDKLLIGAVVYNLLNDYLSVQAYYVSASRYVVIDVTYGSDSLKYTGHYSVRYDRDWRVGAGEFVDRFVRSGFINANHQAGVIKMIEVVSMNLISIVPDINKE